MAKTRALQDTVLAALRDQGEPVVVYLRNRLRLSGRITDFDNFVIYLDNGSEPIVVFKHNISTIMPDQPGRERRPRRTGPGRWRGRQP